MTIDQICDAFGIDGKVVRFEVIKNGIINNSYKVCCEEGGDCREYVVQRINKSVFKRPDRIMANIVGVTDFIRAKMIKEGRDPERYVLRYCVTPDGKNYISDESGEYWRAYSFIKDSVVYNDAEDGEIIEQVGKAFGEFQMYLCDYDATKLYYSIPNFHNTARRFEAFYDAVRIDAADRVKEVGEEIEVIGKHEQLATKLSLMATNSQIPLRVTHNDTKCNNVVFDRNKKEALAVIDLDTVMPGLVAFDFGDAARFICSNAAEDEPDLKKVSFNLDKFRALAKGFVGTVGKRLTRLEVDTLALGVYSMTVELAVRFLTDYLNGDEYFKIDHPKHNLERARCQLHLARDIARHMDQLEAVVKEYI